VVSDSSEFHCTVCPVESVWSGGVGLVCGMKRGIYERIELIYSKNEMSNSSTQFKASVHLFELQSLQIHLRHMELDP
jgi:hypothetical protein